MAGIFVESFIYDVEPGTHAILFDKFKGLSTTSKGEGTHFKIPVLQEPIMMDVRSRPRETQSLTGTKDLQIVDITLRVLCRPDEDKLPIIYKQLGPRFDDRVLPSLGSEVLKSVVAQYNAEELLSRRAEVSQSIRTALTERARNFNLILDDVAITHLKFGYEFAKAIEQKQVAQQEAETQVYVVAKAEQERQAAIIRAEGEAEAADLISKAMNKAGNGLIEVRRIDAAKEVAHIVAANRNITYLPSSDSSGTNMLIGIDGSR